MIPSVSFVLEDSDIPFPRLLLQSRMVGIKDDEYSTLAGVTR